MVKKLSLPKTLTPTWSFFFCLFATRCLWLPVLLPWCLHTHSQCFFLSLRLFLSQSLYCSPVMSLSLLSISNSHSFRHDVSSLLRTPFFSFTKLSAGSREQSWLRCLSLTLLFSSLPPPPLPSTSSLPCTTPSHTDFKGLWVTQRLCTLSQSDSLVSVPGKKCIWEMSNCCM